MVEKMTARLALRMIREAATDSARVYLSGHAEKRMRQRRITRVQVLECLRRGQITEGPVLDIKGNWTCRVERLVAGDQVKVAVAIERRSNLTVITVI